MLWLRICESNKFLSSFQLGHSLEFWNYAMILGLCCDGIKLLEFNKDYAQRFFVVIANFFGKNKYCNTVKLFKKNEQKLWVLKFIANFVNDLVIND